MIVIGVRSSWLGVGDERALRRERGLQAVEHGVERVRQLADLVVAVDRDAPGQVGVGDRPRGVAELRSGASTRPATTHASTEATSSTETATTAAT